MYLFILFSLAMLMYNETVKVIRSIGDNRVLNSVDHGKTGN